jgi:hypothetical protein
MNCEIINELKGKYREFLATPHGAEVLKHAVEIKTKWVKSQQALRTKRGHATTMNTANVKKQFLPKKIQDRMKLVKITPIGVNNICHRNAEVLSGDGFYPRLGYNIFACPCGKGMSFELHSVNKKDGELYDFTKDFNNENKKWFLEIDRKILPRAFIEIWGKEPMYLGCGCKCNMKWNFTEIRELEDGEELVKRIEAMEQMIIWGLDAYENELIDDYEKGLI